MRPSHFSNTLLAFTFLFAMMPLHAMQASAHGFNANRVHIVRIPANGMYRVLIYYTHVEVGEYREAHIDFVKRADALKVYRDLINGADFFLGDTKESVHFHKEPAKNSPY